MVIAHKRNCPANGIAELVSCKIKREYGKWNNLTFGKKFFFAFTIIVILIALITLKSMTGVGKIITGSANVSEGNINKNVQQSIFIKNR